MIDYLCYDCSKKLKLSGFQAENEVGRKCCSRCGANDTLYVVDHADFEAAMKKIKK